MLCCRYLTIDYLSAVKFEPACTLTQYDYTCIVHIASVCMVTNIKATFYIPLTQVLNKVPPMRTKEELGKYPPLALM